MKTLEIRRHSMRKQGGGSQLSQEGVAHARKLGTSLGPFAQVVTSVVPRTRETAIAVNYEVVMLTSEEEVYAEAETARWWEAAQPFATLAQVIAAKGATYRYAHALLSLWRDILTALPDETIALFIGPSAELEMALVT